MARPFAKGPASLVADRVRDRHSDYVFELLEFSHNDRPMRPGAGPRDIEMVAAARCRVPGMTIRSYPSGKGIRLPNEGALDALLIWKLCLNGHGRDPICCYRTTLRSDKGGEGSGQGALLARRTRTMKRCSRGKRARLGAVGVGRVRMSRAVKGSLGHSP